MDARTVGEYAGKVHAASEHLHHLQGEKGKHRSEIQRLESLCNDLDDQILKAQAAFAEATMNLEKAMGQGPAPAPAPTPLPPAHDSD